MKVSVIGAGAIGGMFGGLIKHHRPEVDVCLIVRGAHGEAIHRRSSITLQGPWGRRDVSVSTSFDIADIESSDYILVTVKSQATKEALSAAARCLGDAIVISIQNGINDGTFAQYVEPSRLAMGMTATNMTVTEPGVVSLQLNGCTVVGPGMNGCNAAAVRHAAVILRSTGLRIVEHPNALGMRYNKLAHNALGYASCLSASNFITEALCHRPWRHAVAIPIVDECMEVFSRAGIKLQRIPGRPDLVRLRRFLDQLDVAILGRIVAAGAQAMYNRRPIEFSLQRDLQQRKKTEVDFINGEIVRLAEEQGGAAPYNDRVVQLCHELEQRGDGSFFDREEVIARMAK